MRARAKTRTIVLTLAACCLTVACWYGSAERRESAETNVSTSVSALEAGADAEPLSCLMQAGGSCWMMPEGGIQGGQYCRCYQSCWEYGQSQCLGDFTKWINPPCGFKDFGTAVACNNYPNHPCSDWCKNPDSGTTCMTTDASCEPTHTTCDPNGHCSGGSGGTSGGIF
jgi:hypothetical protein